MTLDDKVRVEKLQYDINREAAKIWKLSSRKSDKDEYLTGDKILPLDERRVIDQAKFPYSHWGKAFEKQTKMIEERRKNK